MKNWLMKEKLWRILEKSCPDPLTIATDISQADIEARDEKIEDWQETNAQALGTIRLRLHYTISSKYKDADNAGDLWKDIKKEYGRPGIIGAYIELKAALDTNFPANADPSPTFDRMTSHFARCAELKVDIADHIRALIVLARLPPYADSVAALIAQTEEITKIALDD